MSEFPKEELLSAYLDGELTDAERAEVEKLLADDASARARLDELRELSKAVRGLETLKLDEDLAARVLRVAERRMLTDSPGIASAEESLCGSAPAAFWKTVARRLLGPRAIAWSAMAVAVAILLSIYGPEEKPAVRGPIAMQMESELDDEKLDGAADAQPAELAAKQGPGSSDTVAAEKAAAESIASESPPGVPRLLGVRESSAAEAAAQARAAPKPPPTVTVNVRCYCVSSPADAREALQRILAKQTTSAAGGRNELRRFGREASDATGSGGKIAAPRSKKSRPVAEAKPAADRETLSLEATPAELRRILAEIRQQPSIFSSYVLEVDAAASAPGRQIESPSEASKSAIALDSANGSFDTTAEMPPLFADKAKRLIVFSLQADARQSTPAVDVEPR